MAAPLSDSLLRSVIYEYDPESSEGANDAVSGFATQTLQQNRGLGEISPPSLSRAVSPIPNDAVLESSLSESSAADLSQSLMSLRKKGLSPEKAAEFLMRDRAVREKFRDKEELVKILSGLLFLLEDLIPEEPPSSNETEPINAGWIYVSQRPSHASESRHSYLWSAVTGVWNVAKQISEVKGVASSLMALYFLSKDPRAIILIKGLKWLVGLL